VWRTAKVLSESQYHINKSYELTNNETLTFTEMAEKISKGIGKTINLFRLIYWNSF
jgi:uncharacterized protein YbjT (DUF2867 family)